MKPYCLKDLIQGPSVLLPDEARGILRREVESIRKAYKQGSLKAQALDLVIERVRKDYPQAFSAEK